MISVLLRQIFFFNLFIWLHWVFVAVHGLSLVAASGGYSSSRCSGFSLQWLLLLRSTGSRREGFSSCGSQAQQLWLAGSRVQAQKLWRMALVALQHVGSSQTRVQTHVPCIGRQILNHCATREVPSQFFERKSTKMFTQNYGTERSSNLYQVTQLANSRGEILIQAAWLQSPILYALLPVISEQ